MTIEHWGWISTDENAKGERHSWNEREDDFSSVAFWYQTGEPTPAPPVPSAAERRLANLDETIYAKDFTDTEHHGAGPCHVQDNLSFYPDGQMFYKPTSPVDAWVEIPFSITKSEPQRLVLAVTRANDYGIYQAYLNGVKIGQPMDLFAKDVSEWECHLLDFWPEPGDFTLRLECVGKNDQSTGHCLGLESVRLRQRRPRVKEWARDKGNDWKQNPVLYD